MSPRRALLVLLLLAGLTASAGCASRDEKAGLAAIAAENAIERNDLATARRSIRQAIAARDDVSEYWALLGRISLMAGDQAAAFDAFQSVIQLDPANVDALRLLCQLAISLKQPDSADRYADQLLVLRAGDPMPLVMKGSAALQRGDERAALGFAEQVLAAHPDDKAGALVLKGRALLSLGRYAESIRLIEGSLAAGGDQTGRLALLQDLYSRTGDRSGYERTVAQRARVQPADATVQLGYADMLYQIGQGEAACDVLARLMRRKPNDIALATRIIDTWLRQGHDAVPADQILARAAGTSLETRAAYAQFANEIGRPDLTFRLLGDAAGARPNNANADAQVAQAFAMALTGHPATALQQLDSILAADPSQPRALLARARLEAAAGRRAAAISDARRVLGDDPRNVPARILLARLLQAQGDPLLASGTLREGIALMPTETRLAARLSTLLLGQGKPAEAGSVLRTLTDADPMNLRNRRLRDELCRNSPEARCTSDAPDRGAQRHLTDGALPDGAKPG